MENLPLYISIFFVLTTSLSLFIFNKATNHSKPPLLIILFLIVAQTFLSLNYFYTITDTIPPRFILLIAPPLLLMFILFSTSWGKRFLNNLNIKYLTLLHVVRFPVELVLFWLFLHGAVPEIMTFEGRNLDILAGLSAPVVYYFGFVKKRMNNITLLVWNFICLALLFNIVIHAILSAPSPFQQLAFNQPNVAVLYFPFVLLPACIVPLVLFSHLVSIRSLLVPKSKLAKWKFEKDYVGV
jgi:hypothetical protein